MLYMRVCIAAGEERPSYPVYIRTAHCVLRPTLLRLDRHVCLDFENELLVGRGIRIVDESGGEVILPGAGLGGWMT